MAIVLEELLKEIKAEPLSPPDELSESEVAFFEKIEQYKKDNFPLYISYFIKYEKIKSEKLRQ